MEPTQNYLTRGGEKAVELDRSSGCTPWVHWTARDYLRWLILCHVTVSSNAPQDSLGPPNDFSHQQQLTQSTKRSHKITMELKPPLPSDVTVVTALWCDTVFPHSPCGDAGAHKPAVRPVTQKHRGGTYMIQCLTKWPCYCFCIPILHLVITVLLLTHLFKKVYCATLRHVTPAAWPTDLVPESRGYAEWLICEHDLNCLCHKLK
jgi:hypothetical protein